MEIRTVILGSIHKMEVALAKAGIIQLYFKFFDRKI